MKKVIRLHRASFWPVELFWYKMLITLAPCYAFCSNFEYFFSFFFKSFFFRFLSFDFFFFFFLNTYIVKYCLATGMQNGDEASSSIILAD